MDLSPVVILPRDLQRRCWRFGLDLAASYKKPRTQSARNSAAVSSHGVERDPVKLAWSKMAECAFCYWADLDIEDLKWETDRADPGSDIRWYLLLIDVKHTFWPNGHLIWPINKRLFFDSKKFDVLVLVRGREDFEISGWCFKHEFKANYCELGTDDEPFPMPSLTKGTWVYTGVLKSMAELMPDDVFQPLAQHGRQREGIEGERQLPSRRRS